MCSQDDREETAEGVVDNRAVHQIVEDPELPEPPEHYKDVRAFRRRHLHLHHFIGGNRRSALPHAAQIIAHAVSEGSRHNEASLLGSQLDPLPQNHSPRHQTLEHCTP